MSRKIFFLRFLRLFIIESSKSSISVRSLALIFLLSWIDSWVVVTVSTSDILNENATSLCSSSGGRRYEWFPCRLAQEISKSIKVKSMQRENKFVPYLCVIGSLCTNEVFLVTVASGTHACCCIGKIPVGLDVSHTCTIIDLSPRA